MNGNTMIKLPTNTKRDMQVTYVRLKDIESIKVTSYKLEVKVGFMKYETRTRIEASVNLYGGQPTWFCGWPIEERDLAEEAVESIRKMVNSVNE